MAAVARVHDRVPGEGRSTVVVVAGYAPSLLNFRGPLLRALIERGHRVVACAPPAEPAVSAALAALGVRFVAIPIDRTGLNPRGDLSALRRLIAVFKEVEPDVVLSYTAKAVIYGSLAAWIARVPRRYAMITGLGYAFGDAAGPYGRFAARAARELYRWSLKTVERVFFQNPDDRAEFEGLGLVHARQAVLINGSGVDLDAFSPAPLPTSETSFLLIARLLAEKGIRVYAEAARRVRAAHPDTVFRLVGWLDAGNPAALTEREVQSWVDEGIIQFLGRLGDVRPAIAASSVYVLPSYYREGTPRTVLEAMAMGRAIVTTDSPGCRETVRNGVNGYLVRPRDVDSVVEALLRFIAQPKLIGDMGRESRRIAVEKYDVHKVNAVILETLGLL
jgi:glycosyltransferase involved in cell wall biosynthesis